MAILADIADLMGGKAEQVLYLALLLLAYPLSLVHRFLIPSATGRHVFGLACGLLFAWTAFQYDIVHFFATATGVYCLCRFVPGKTAPILALLFALFYLSFGHLWRMYEAHTDRHWSSPQMLITIKITSFAWSYYDGQRPAESLSESQKARAIQKLPSLLEYFSYIFFFAGFLTGPCPEFKEYKDFVDRSLFKAEGGKIPEGSYFAATRQLMMGLLCLPLHFVYQYVHEGYTLTDEFYQHNFFWKYGYMIVSAEIGFYKYYVVFFLGEGACILSGLGYNGRDKQGRVQWDRVLMLKFFPFKLAQDPSTLAANWNIPSANWLKRYVYVRLLPQRPAKGDTSSEPAEEKQKSSQMQKMLPMFATFFVSAFWHGFYPGYYMFFLSLACFAALGGLNRLYIRPFFLEEDGKTPKYPIKYLYDFMCWFLTFIGLDYHIIVFRTLTFSNGMKAWGSVYFFPHILGLLCALYYIIIGPPRRRSRKPQQQQRPSSSSFTGKEEQAKRPVLVMAKEE
ncbi:Lysophospholipid acyltransferase [Balamuthia mandrillaris]